MDREVFSQRFGLAHAQALELARSTVTDELPSSVRFLLKPNSSHSSDPLYDDEEIFPEDTRPEQPYVGPLNEDEAVAWLWRHGKVPEWIDLAVLRQDGRHSYFGLLCCGRFTGQDYLLYHQDEGYPPFHATPPRPPDGWQDLARDGRFSLYWHAEANKSQDSDKA
jgi:hypothetical protein